MGFVSFNKNLLFLVMGKFSNDAETKRWGEYYFADKRNPKKSWVLELIYTINQMIPSFNELFDQV